MRARDSRNKRTSARPAARGLAGLSQLERLPPTMAGGDPHRVHRRILRRNRERLQDPDLDRGGDLHARRHRQEVVADPGETLRNATDIGLDRGGARLDALLSPIRLRQCHAEAPNQMNLFQRYLDAADSRIDSNRESVYKDTVRVEGGRRRYQP